MAESQADFSDIFLQFLNQVKYIPVGKQTQPCLPLVVLHVNTLSSGMSDETVCCSYIYRS